MKRSNEPLFWSLFGAGGMLSALVGPALIFLTGLAIPAGLLFRPDAMSFERMSAFMQSGFAKIAVVAVISLFLWHGCHRLLHLLHDLGIHGGAVAKVFFYGLALAGTVAAIALALASASRDVSYPHTMAAVGEISLAGEIRPVSSPRQRASEAGRLGFSQLVDAESGNLREALRRAFSAASTPRERELDGAF